MKALGFVLVLACAASGEVALVAPAAAGAAGNADAAHVCRQGPQIDYYTVVGAPPGAAVGTAGETTEQYVLTDSHGACGSFFAQHRPGRQKPGKIAFTEFQITRAVDRASAG